MWKMILTLKVSRKEKIRRLITILCNEVENQQLLKVMRDHSYEEADIFIDVFCQMHDDLIYSILREMQEVNWIFPRNYKFVNFGPESLLVVLYLLQEDASRFFEDETTFENSLREVGYTKELNLSFDCMTLKSFRGIIV